MLSIKLKLLGVASVYLWHMMASASAFAPSSLSIDAGATRLTTTLPSSRVHLRPLSAGDNNNTRRYANGIGGFDLLSKTKKSVSISSSVPASTKNGVINISKKKALPTKAASSPLIRKASSNQIWWMSLIRILGKLVRKIMWSKLMHPLRRKRPGQQFSYHS